MRHGVLSTWDDWVPRMLTSIACCARMAPNDGARLTNSHAKNIRAKDGCVMSVPLLMGSWMSATRQPPPKYDVR